MFKTFYFYKFVKNYFKISTCFPPTIYGFLSNQRNIKYHPIIHISILYCIVSENNKFQLPISSYQKLQALGHKNVVLYLQVLKIILSKHNWMFFMKDNHFRMGNTGSSTNHHLDLFHKDMCSIISSNEKNVPKTLPT